MVVHEQHADHAIPHLSPPKDEAAGSRTGSYDPGRRRAGGGGAGGAAGRGECIHSRTMSTNTATLPATLRRAVVPRSNIATSVLLVTGGALFVALFAQISIQLPFTPVPITGQTFAVLLVAASMGLVHGTLAMVMYLAMGVFGIPVFADRAHGWDEVAGATGGYLVGFVLAGLLVGFLAERRWDRNFSSSVSAMLTGNVLVFTVGLVWLSVWLGDNGYPNGLNAVLENGLYPFVPGEILKLYLAGALLPAAWRLVERIRRS